LWLCYGFTEYFLMSVFVTLGGVLATTDRIKGFHPIVEGLKFVSALAQAYKVTLGVINQSQASIDHFLMLNGLYAPFNFDRIVYPEPADKSLSDAEKYLAQIGRQGNIDFVVSHDADVIDITVKEGYTSLLWVKPAYSRREFQPGIATVKPWAQIMAEQERQALAKREDQRLKLMEESEL
jgi:hypothetical protein